jgi:hypothetical protein
MKNWQKVLAFVFMAAVLMLEACHRGYGCPGADLLIKQNHAIKLDFDWFCG